MFPQSTCHQSASRSSSRWGRSCVWPSPPWTQPTSPSPGRPWRNISPPASQVSSLSGTSHPSSWWQSYGCIVHHPHELLEWRNFLAYSTYSVPVCLCGHHYTTSRGWTVIGLSSLLLSTLASSANQLHNKHLITGAAVCLSSCTCYLAELGGLSGAWVDMAKRGCAVWNVTRKLGDFPLCNLCGWCTMLLEHTITVSLRSNGPRLPSGHLSSILVVNGSWVKAESHIQCHTPS